MLDNVSRVEGSHTKSKLWNNLFFYGHLSDIVHDNTDYS